MAGDKAGPEAVFEAGIFLVDKPVGPTSFRIVQQVRRALQIKKVGHAGTLDPFASGLLVVCAGRAATRLVPRLMAGEKEYEATLQLGVETDTQDPEGQVVAESLVPELDMAAVQHCLAGFVGRILQVPPRFSALKHKGKPMYYYARRGVEVAREPRPVEVKGIECLAPVTQRWGPENDTLKIRVICGKGTYIRTLAADIGTALGCGAHLRELRRLRVGPFSVTSSLDGAALADSREGRVLLLAHQLTVDAVVDRLV